MCAVSRYKVINATLLAHIHLIAELPKESHVSHKKSLRGEIMLGEQSGAHRPVWILYSPWYSTSGGTLNASFVQNTTAQNHKGSNDRHVKSSRGAGKGSERERKSREQRGGQ